MGLDDVSSTVGTGPDPGGGGVVAKTFFGVHPSNLFNKLTTVIPPFFTKGIPTSGLFSGFLNVVKGNHWVRTLPKKQRISSL